MHDYIDLGGAPAKMDCAQLGLTSDFDRFNRLECDVYIAALIANHGPPPAGARYTITANTHDFGTYREVRLRYDPANADHGDYASRVENGLANWAPLLAPVVYGIRGDVTWSAAGLNDVVRTAIHGLSHGTSAQLAEQRQRLRDAYPQAAEGTRPSIEHAP